MVLLSTRDSAFFKRYNQQQKIEDAVASNPDDSKSHKQSETSSLFDTPSSSEGVETELRPVLTKKTQSRLSLLMRKKKPDGKSKPDKASISEPLPQ
jgi:hypothetical protein